MKRHEWDKAATARLRMVHTATGTAGNVVAHWRNRATLFLRYEQVGAAQLPVFEQFAKADLEPESGSRVAVSKQETRTTTTEAQP